MTRKPTYEDLEQRIKLLEEESIKGQHAVQALRESEEYYKEITENASDIIITDNNGDIKYCSPSIERFAGYTPEDLAGKSGSIRLFFTMS